MKTISQLHSRIIDCPAQSDEGKFIIVYNICTCKLSRTICYKNHVIFFFSQTEETHPINWRPDIVKKKRY